MLEAKGYDRRYQFRFLSPKDYDDFFTGLRNGDLGSFTSSLQTALT